MHDPIQLFDRKLLRRHKERAAPGFARCDFLWREACERLSERLEDITRRFPLALELGSHQDLLREALHGRGGVERLVQTSLTRGMLAGPGGILADEELLPFAENRFDIVLSSLALHWVNDVPGTLVQIRRALKEDGLLLANFLGGETLKELHQSIASASIRTEGGLAPRVSPFIEVREAGALLHRAGFALPVVDSETIIVTYPDAFALMRELRGMGESNALIARLPHFSRRATLLAIAAEYQERFGDEEGRIPATFEIITMTGWKPHGSQPQPARRGSGKVSLTMLGE